MVAEWWANVPLKRPESNPCTVELLLIAVCVFVCVFSYKLYDNRSCIDVDECKEEPGICSQDCVNEIGGFKCECVEGYMRDVHNHTRCKAMESHASLLLARRHDIRKIALDHKEMTSIVNNTKSATALDYVFRTGMIFWSDVSTQSIYK